MFCVFKEMTRVYAEKITVPLFDEGSHNAQHDKKGMQANINEISNYRECLTT